MRRKTHTEHVADIKKVNPNVEVLEEIKGNGVKVLCRCTICNHKWSTRPRDLKSGYGCPKCARNIKKLTHTEQAEAINKVNPNIEILEEITGSHKKVLCRCKICGHEWGATPSNLKKGTGCPACAKMPRKMTHAEHVAAITKINPNIEALEEIKGDKVKTLFRCKVCGHEWSATPSGLKQGHGCPACARERINNANKLTRAEHIAAIAKVNPNVEVLGKIINNQTKVLCRCKVCNHKWEVTPDKLKQGRGCPKCAGKMKLSHTEQVLAINKVNPDVEVLGEIKNNSTKVLCCCKICQHEWFAAPYTLKSGVGCPRCAKYGFHSHDIGKLYIMVDDLNVPTMMKIGVSVDEDERSKKVLRSAHKAGVTIPALHVAKTWEGPTELMTRIEQMMHENYEEWNIKFPTKFDGYKEFFYYTHETAAAFEVIEETIHEIINANKAA